VEAANGRVISSNWHKKKNLKAQQQTVSALGSQLAAAQSRIEGFERQKTERLARLQNHQNTLARAAEIRAAYDAYNQLLERLRQAEAQAEQFRPIESELKTYRQQLEMERQRLTTTVEHLQQEEARIRQSAADARALEQQRQDLGQMVSALTQEINNAADLESLLTALETRKKALNQENGELRARMQDLQERIAQLAQVADAVCPLCGQPLTEEHRAELSKELTAKGTSLGDQYRANKKALEEAEAEEEALRQARRNLEKINPNCRSTRTRLPSLICVCRTSEKLSRLGRQRVPLIWQRQKNRLKRMIFCPTSGSK